ncbi:hypothetical protein ACJJTC_009353 [Scirpophaga incertulas]
MAVEAHERRALRPRRANRTRSTNGAAQAREFETLLIPQYTYQSARSDGAAETRDCKTSLKIFISLVHLITHWSTNSLGLKDYQGQEQHFKLDATFNNEDSDD